MTLADFFYDHPLYINRAIKNKPGLYLMIHLAAIYPLYAYLIPATAIFMKWWYPGFVLTMLCVILILYILWALPFRVLGGEEPVAYVCLVSSFVMPWYFL